MKNKLDGHRKSHTAVRLRLHLAICLMLGLWAFGLHPGSAVSAQSTALVWVNPAQGVVYPGGSLEVTLDVTGGENVNAFDVAIRYNPDLVNLDSWQPGTYLSNLFRVYASDQPGLLRLAFTQLATPGVSGDGVLLRLVFSGLALGQSEIVIEQVVLADPLGNETLPQAQNGALQVLQETPPELTQTPTEIIAPTTVTTPYTPTESTIGTQIQPTSAGEPVGSATGTFSLRDTQPPPGVTIMSTSSASPQPTPGLTLIGTQAAPVTTAAAPAQSTLLAFPVISGGQGAAEKSANALLEGILWGLLVSGGVGIVVILVLLALRRKKS